MMKFVADGMLGKLTRWLRLAGEDVVCVNDFSVSSEGEDEFLLDLAERECRMLITRDVDLHRRALRNGLESILLEDEKEEVAQQMKKISEEIGKTFDISAETSRCPVCNGELKTVEKNKIKKDIPEGVLKNNDRFWKCQECGKVYWLGGHWEKIEETIEKIRE